MMPLVALLLSIGTPQIDDGLLMRVCDIGPGLACAIRIPDGDSFRYVVYDTGHWSYQRLAREKMNEVVPVGSRVDWFILSHTDGDHIATVDELLADYEASRIVWPDNPRNNNGWRAADAAITQETQSGAMMFRPEDSKVRPGKTYRIGDGTIQFISGFSTPPTSWGLARGSGPYNNAGSVVVAIKYKRKRILLTGDAVGRELGGPADQCIASEAFMLHNLAFAPLKSDVLVAPHHGADNGSSTAFIAAVKPKKVIFSSGHEYQHPTKAAAGRYILFGLDKDRDIFRTDLGDREPGNFEWQYVPPGLNIDRDVVGRDDVEIKIGRDGTLTVAYHPTPQ